ncbi:MAG: cation transporting ATPase C-terminal domain-containing protein, partial [Rhodocyclaceae bacterium]
RDNILLLAALAAEAAIIAAIVYTETGNSLFGTAPLEAEPWLLAGALALVMLFLEEGRKALMRLLAGRRRAKA